MLDFITSNLTGQNKEGLKHLESVLGLKKTKTHRLS